jgi:uroporphyrinogen-III synthase
MAAALIIVTRPGDAGARWQQRLQAAGYAAQWWPAFELGPAPDEARARAGLDRLAQFDLAVFVSPIAVAATAQRLARPWPASTAIGAVGAATRAAVVATWPAATALVAPLADEAAGSEAFWEAWLRSGRPATRVLILRAQHGREWLAQQFAATGAEVETLAVYARMAHELSAPERAALDTAVAAGVPAVTIFTSTEAIAALDDQVAATRGADRWLRDGRALATHPRIRERLLDAGYRTVELSAADDEGLLARLESMKIPRT